MAGLWFEDFAEGMVFDHALRRSVTEADNMWFCNATLNTQPLHIDFDFAAGTEFGRPLVNSIFTLGLMIGISVSETTQGTTLGNLGMTDVAFPHPVFHGDTISARTTVEALRESRSRPENGLVTLLHEAFNQDGTRVATCRRTALMRKRPA